MLELLRPPPHRGPLIAAGAVALAVGLGLAELRLAGELTPGYHLFVLAVVAGIVLALGVQAPDEDAAPPAYKSVLLVTGLLVLYAALLRLADALGDSEDALPAATITLTALAEAGAALAVAVRSRSAVCGLLAAVFGMVAVLAGWEWAFDPDDFGVARWLLGLGAAGLVLGGLALRSRRPRQAELLIDAAGLALLAIALQPVVGAFTIFGGFTEPGLPGFWEVIVLGAGFGLVAFGAIDRSPGPAWLGVANLAAFVAVVGAGDATLRWWPLLLILVGAVAMAAGLRPRKPLPPEPDAYRAGDAPLASRSEEELVLQVRVDDAPPR